jgi:hypothetical protein
MAHSAFGFGFAGGSVGGREITAPESASPPDGGFFAAWNSSSPGIVSMSGNRRPSFCNAGIFGLAAGSEIAACAGFGARGDSTTIALGTAQETSAMTGIKHARVVIVGFSMGAAAAKRFAAARARVKKSRCAQGAYTREIAYILTTDYSDYSDYGFN